MLRQRRHDLRRRRDAGDAVPADPATARRCNAAIPFQLQHQRAHPPQHDRTTTPRSATRCSPARRRARAASRSAPVRDDYQIDHNWIAGNLSTGDGGGMQHARRELQRQDRQQLHPVQPEHQPDPADQRRRHRRSQGANEPSHAATAPSAAAATDIDCPPGLGDGTGAGLVIDANLILGNSAESGSGGGLRLQQINGTRGGRVPRTPDSQWYDVTRHQQHHRQQRGRLGRRRRVAAGRAEGELRQQHGGVQRHDGLGRRAVQDAGRDQCAAAAAGLQRRRPTRRCRRIRAAWAPTRRTARSPPAW